MWQNIIDFLDELPLTELTVGIVVPLISAFLSYFLVEKASKKKESNKLYIQIELLRRELKCNKLIINNFIELYKKYLDIQKSLLINNPFFNTALYEVLNKLEKIKDDYFISGEHIFERPSILIILQQEIEKLEGDLYDIKQGITYNENPVIVQQKASVVIKLEKQIKDKKNELSKNIERNIYKEFKQIQEYMDSNLIEGWLDKIHNNDSDNLIMLKRIYDTIKIFNSVDNKKEDVVKLYRNLLIFRISTDGIINDGIFDEDMFKFYYEETYEEQPMINILKNFYHYKVLQKRIASYEFKIKYQRWDSLKNELVLINDRQLYIQIDDFYNEIDLLKSYESTEVNELELAKANEKCIELFKNVNVIENRILKKEKKVKKKC